MRLSKYQARTPKPGASRLKTSAMIASLAAEGLPTKAAPFGHALSEVASRRPDVVGMTADLSKYTDLHVFAQQYPDRFFQMGMAEQLMVSAAAGMALSLASACRTRRQAQTFANVAILIVSAVGGSMVPRFFMPPLLQDLGWITPNTWALEAYTAIFWRDEPISALWIPWGALTAAAVAGLMISRRLARRMQTI